jgi:hypothetical protein
MNLDDDLAALSADWKHATMRLDEVEQNLAKRRRKHRITMFALWMGVLLNPVMLPFVLYRFVMANDLFFLVGIIMMVMMTPLLLIEMIERHRHAKGDFDQPTEDVLIVARRQISFELRMVRISRYTTAVIALCALAMFGLVLLHRVELRAGIVVVVIWAATAAFTLLLQRGQQRTLIAEGEACDRLIVEFNAGKVDLDAN